MYRHTPSPWAFAPGIGCIDLGEGFFHGEAFIDDPPHSIRQGILLRLFSAHREATIRMVVWLRIHCATLPYVTVGCLKVPQMSLSVGSSTQINLISSYSPACFKSTGEFSGILWMPAVTLPSLVRNVAAHPCWWIVNANRSRLGNCFGSKAPKKHGKNPGKTWKNHGKTMGKHGKTMGKHGKTMGKHGKTMGHRSPVLAFGSHLPRGQAAPNLLAPTAVWGHEGSGRGSRLVALPKTVAIQIKSIWI